MNKIEINQENGKRILRQRSINFTVFKYSLSKILNGTKSFNEDEWTSHYNSYAESVGRDGFEPVKTWAREYFQLWTEGEHRAWLKRYKKLNS
jgi:hypothetical protein